MRTSTGTRFSQYSLNSPYGHLYNTDTSVKRTLGSVPFGIRIKEVWKYKVVCARKLAAPFWRENEIAVVILQRVLATMQ